MVKRNQKRTTGRPPGRPPGPAVPAETHGAVALLAAVLRQAVIDARRGNEQAAVWLQTWGKAWAHAAGLDSAHSWADVLERRGFIRQGEYMPDLDHPHVTADLLSKPPARSGRPPGRPRTRPEPPYCSVRLQYINDATNRSVLMALRAALVSCDGDLAAALGELRGTPAGDRLQTWLLGES